METLIDDLLANMETYYDQFVNFLPKLIIALIIFFLLFRLTKRVQKETTNRLTAKMDDPLLARFLGQVVWVIGMLITVMLCFKILGLGDLAAGLFAGASFSAVVVGFAFKDIGENFLSGIILAFNRPFRVGDTVELNGITGSVVGLEMRTTHLKSFDGKDVYIPNASVVKSPVVNFTIDGFLRQDLTFGLDYGADVERAIDLIEKEIASVDGVITDRKGINVFMSNMNTSTLDITAQYWLDTFDKRYSGAKIKTEIALKVLSELESKGYYLPGNVVEIKNYRGEEYLGVGGK